MHTRLGARSTLTGASDPSLNRRGWVTIVVLSLLCLALFVISFRLGRFPVPPGDLFKFALTQMSAAGWQGDPSVAHVIANIRLPRLALAMLIGMALSTAGVVYQQMFRNPLVSPDILGASAGAGFGASLAITVGASLIWIQGLAFVCGLLAVMAAWGASRAMRRDAILGLVLAGIVVSAIFSAGTSFLKYVADPDDALPAITFWLMGGLSGVRLGDIFTVAVPALICIGVLWVNRWRLNVLSFGDDTAKALGVNVTVLRAVVIVCATLLTTTAVSVGGLIAWVGLVVPHLARMIVGPDMRVLLVTSALMGAAFLLLVDDIARNWLTMEIPLGILTAVVGAPFLLALIIANREW